MFLNLALGQTLSEVGLGYIYVMASLKNGSVHIEKETEFVRVLNSMPML